MKLLTVNCYDGDAAVFAENNEGLFRLAEEDPRFGICIPESLKEDRYGSFRSLLTAADSEYVMFTDSDAVMQRSDVQGILNALQLSEKEIYSLAVNKEKLAAGPAPAGMISREIRDPSYFPRYIFRKDLLERIEIGEGQKQYFEDAVLLEMLGGYLPEILDAVINCSAEERLEENQAKYDRAFEKSWYAEHISDILTAGLEKGLSYNGQCFALYLLYLKYYVNQTIYDKYILDDDGFSRFEQLAADALRLIDRAVYSDAEVVNKLESEYCRYLYNLGRNGDISVSIDEGRILVDGVPCTKNSMQCVVYAINIIKDELVVDAAVINNVFEMSQNGSIAASAGGREYPMVRTDIYSEIRAFGHTVLDRPTYQIRISLEDAAAGVRITGRAGSDQIVIPLGFRKVASRLTDKSANSYCRLNGYLLSYRKGTLHVQRGYKGWIGRELRFLRDIPRIRKDRRDARNAIILRILYRLYSIFSSSRPKWVFFDKIYKGGDNGEHLFSYACENVSYADSYYIIRKDTKDYPRLRARYGRRVLAYNSLRQKLIVMKADMLFATHANAFQFCGFGPTLQACFRGELKARVVCIQHGLTIQDMPQHQSRLVDNTRAYYCASEKEIINLRQTAYGYAEDELLLTGLPRYDGLKSRDIRQILITPTWRRELVISGNRTGDSKEYNPRFRESEYFRIYNELINNEKMLKCAEETGYSIMFLLHPTLGAQLKDFSAPDAVKLVNGATALYDDILAESSLMVTDYSGVQFDFAYMKKPVVYYHPEELPPQYESGHFSYAEDGFGPIISKQAELVDALCDYMKNGCAMEERYSDRVGRFFRYTDDRNCERICAAVKEQFY